MYGPHRNVRITGDTVNHDGSEYEAILYGIVVEDGVSTAWLIDRDQAGEGNNSYFKVPLVDPVVMTDGWLNAGIGIGGGT